MTKHDQKRPKTTKNDQKRPNTTFGWNGGLKVFFEDRQTLKNTQKHSKTLKVVVNLPENPTTMVRNTLKAVSKKIDFEHYLRILPEIIYLREGDISIFCLKKNSFSHFSRKLGRIELKTKRN